LFRRSGGERRCQRAQEHSAQPTGHGTQEMTPSLCLQTSESSFRMQFTGKIKIVISRNAVEGIGHLDHLFMAASRFKSTPATALSPPNCLGTNAALGCGFSEIRSLAACSTGIPGM